MKISKTAGGLIASLSVFAVGQDEDPFGSSDQRKKPPTQEFYSFEERSDIEVLDHYLLDLVPSEDWPKHKVPRTINDYFEQPRYVWRADGGYFIAYDGGEFGGALFFRESDSESLVKVLDSHVSSIVRVGPANYIAAGGSAHLSEKGSVHRIWVSKNLSWKNKKIFFTFLGIPHVSGVTQIQHDAVVTVTRRVTGEKRYETFVFTINEKGETNFHGVGKFVEKPYEKGR